MKKFIYIFIKTASLATLVLVVFTTNVYSTVFKKSAKVKKSEGNERFFANAFAVPTAFADLPGGPGGPGDPGGPGGPDSGDDCDGGDGDC